MHVAKRNFKGEPVIMKETLQRLCIRQKREDNRELESKLMKLPKTKLSPSQISRLPGFLTADMISCVYEDEKTNVLWLGTDKGLWRINESEDEPLDVIQHFRASAYMLDNNVLSVCGDGDNGVFVLTDTSVSHIEMKLMSAKEKASFLSEMDFKYVQRRGMLSGARRDEKNNCWKGRESDNDGLWTSLVAMGDICRYAVLRDSNNADKKEIAKAREHAMRWTEAILLLAYIPGRKGKVPAFVRYNKPGTNRASKEYLLEGKDGSLNIPEKGPAGYILSSLGPNHPENWATEGMPEVEFVNLSGFIARSYHVNDPENDPVPWGDGVFFRKMYDDTGKLISFRVPSSTKKGDDCDTPLYVDSSMPIPDRLRKLYTDGINPATGKSFTDADIIYKCDTSNDELVAHYAIWHLAYDVFGKEDPELAEIIKNAVTLHAQHFTDNNYCLVDAGGQPTSWARMSREYYLNAFSNGFTDGPLGTMILLQLYKVAHYITGDKKWDDEYRKLALDEPYRYADLAAEHYGRYAMLAKTFIDDEDDEQEVFAQVAKMMNYSDIRMAAVAYYTLLQLETDAVLLDKYKKGADSWWRLVKYGRDVEWLLIYQLCYNEEDVVDGFSRKCKDMLKWQLSHFPVCARQFFIDNSDRPDLREEDGLMWERNKNVPYAVSMDERGSLGNNFFHAKQGTYNRSLHECYNMIFPYWVGRYNGLIVDEGKDSSLTFDELMKYNNQE
ncbi:MAG: hypothetical protein BWY46_01614 [Firmicutes bacterium ADurb.Bin300]|nr:MAG: hypothetical protein BWY46_01614 [Firmicutes bacterium ADurb.Bin300]